MLTSNPNFYFKIVAENPLEQFEVVIVTTLLSSVGPSIMYFHNSLLLYMCAQLKNHQLNQNLLGLARFDKINKAQKIDNTASCAKFYIFSTCSIKI